MNPARPRSILVLCTGNSARSQMAQSYLGRHLGDRVRVYSAGTEPASQVHPMARTVLEEAGFDIGDRRPTHYSEYLGHLDVHTLVTVCDGAATSCPSVWPGLVERLAWPFDDPAAFEGSEAEQLGKFRSIRDAIEMKSKEYAKQQLG